MHHLHILTSKTFIIHCLLLFTVHSVTFADELVGDASLTINFPGLSGVHTEIRISDDSSNSATGSLVKNANWKNNSATVIVRKGIYDLIVKKGGGRLIIDDVNCQSDTCQVDNIVAELSINFTGISSVHSSVHVADDSDGVASGDQINKKNWQNNQTVIPILRQIVDLKVNKGGASLIVDNIDCRSGYCEADDLTASLLIKFPGLSSVHSSVRISDQVSGQAEGQEVTKKNWQNNQAEIIVFKQQYDLFIQLGAGSVIVDDVDCSSGFCLVENLQTTLTINFDGISGVHTSVRLSDSSLNLASGREITKKNWQSNQAVISLFPGIYDLVIKKGEDSLILDDVDCTASTCLVDDITAQLRVNFPGLSAVHTSIYAPDQVANQVSGNKVHHKNWQTDQAVLTVFKKRYDVTVHRKKSSPIISDNIDCTTGLCEINDLVSTLTINFPGMTSVFNSIRETDNLPGAADGEEFTHKNWQTNQTTLTVLRNHYDVSIKSQNSHPVIFDDIDCTQSTCNIENFTTTLTVNFPGMRSVHTSLFIPDGNPGVVEGKEAFKLNWQNDQAVLTVFKQNYDVSVRKNNSESIIIDQVDCTDGPCEVNQITAMLTVNFPGLTSTHTSVFVPDNTEGLATGNEVTHKNWQKNKAVIPVFRQRYDVQVRQGNVTKVVDNVDCISGTCLVDDLTALLTIDFPGLQGVHTSTHIPDNQALTATGNQVAKSNWKTHQTTITLLKETYDVKVKHSVDSIFDNIDCNQPTCRVEVTGNVQAVLIDGDLNSPIAEKLLVAYEKLPDGSLQQILKGKTTDEGRVNFTLPGINSGKVYVLKTYNPFSNKKSYFSPFINSEGAFQFIVTVDAENSLDLTPPETSFTTPIDGSYVSNLGFLVTGLATDNRTINRVELSISDPILGVNVISASYNTSTQSWMANVPEAMITLGQDILLTSTAFDQAQNQHSASVTVTVVADIVGPQIEFTSHQDNDEVAVTGFLLSGTVTDLTGVATLKANLVDSSLGQTILDQDIDFSIVNGVWTLVVNNGDIADDATIEITINATDTVGNNSSNSIQLNVVAVNYSTAQMINRITFGATPALVQEVNSIGAIGFLEQQLSPDNIDDSELSIVLDELLATGTLPATKEELQTWTLMHMIYSKRQLLEVMTWFWDNHFNTDINSRRNNAQGVELNNTVAYELAENQNFRTNALGNFRTLLGISAKSPSMLIYLDSISNVVDDSNENYSREVNELHTMGVDGGYTDLDVEIGAEVFTGWHIQDNAFFFDTNLHTEGSYTLFAGTPQEVIIPDGGVSQGEQFLDALATHPSTANFICTKLITLFVSDTPPELLVSRCANAFINFADDNNQIEHVLRLIMLSPEFNDIDNHRNKIKTPVDFVVGAVRNLEANSNAVDLVSPLRSIGIRLYENPVPTGWSQIGEDWINASLLIERMKWVNSFVRNEPAQDVSSSNPLEFYPTNGYETADGIVGFLFELTVGDDFTQLSRDTALNLLGSDFDISLPESELLLRQLNGSVLSFPQFQFK